MKTQPLISSIAFIFLILIYTSAWSQKDLVTIKFKVSGNCEMCKSTIEKALDVKGIKAATWDAESKMIEVVYNPSKITEDKIHQLIAASGYDTDKVKADDKIYGELHFCCKYPRK